MEVSMILNEEFPPASTGPQYGTIESLVEAQEERRRGLQHNPHSVLQVQEQPSVQSAGTGSRRPAYKEGGRVYEALELRHDVAEDLAADRHNSLYSSFYFPCCINERSGNFMQILVCVFHFPCFLNECSVNFM